MISTDLIVCMFVLVSPSLAKLLRFAIPPIFLTLHCGIHQSFTSLSFMLYLLDIFIRSCYLVILIKTPKVGDGPSLFVFSCRHPEVLPAF